MVYVPIRAVLFDLFDTLLLVDDIEVYYPVCVDKIYKFLSNHAINISYEAFKKIYYTVRDEMVARAQETLEEPHFNLRISQTLQRLGFNLDKSNPIITGATKAFADEFKRHTRLDPETFDVLRQLHKKYKLGLVSNFGIPECCWELLEEHGIKQFFDAITISGDVNQRKPSPEIYQLTLKALGVEAQETIFVGDSLDRDIRGPKNVGMKAVFIKRKPITEDIFVQPDAVIEKLSDLPGLLKNSKWS
jgi:putative hydrolase of the HAD superfamily